MDNCTPRLLDYAANHLGNGSAYTKGSSNPWGLWLAHLGPLLRRPAGALQLGPSRQGRPSDYFLQASKSHDPDLTVLRPIHHQKVQQQH